MTVTDTPEISTPDPDPSATDDADVLNAGAMRGAVAAALGRLHAGKDSARAEPEGPLGDTPTPVGADAGDDDEDKPVFLWDVIPFKDLTEDQKRARLDVNDQGMALRLSHYSDGEILYCPALGFLVWDGHRFKACEEKDTFARRRVMALAAPLRKIEYPALMTAGLTESENLLSEVDRDGAFKAALKRVSKFYSSTTQLGNAAKQKSILDVASKMPEFYVDFDVLDAAHGDLNTPSGVLPLPLSSPSREDDVDVTDEDVRRHDIQRAFESLRPRPSITDDAVTRLTAGTFDVAAIARDDDLAPNWRKHLMAVLPDPKMRKAFQRVCGSNLVSFNPKNEWFIWRGPGGDGKSVTLRAVMNAIADFGVMANVKTFMTDNSSGGDKARNDLMALAGGTRMVAIAEPSPTQELDGGLIKALTGGEEQSNRGNYGAQTTWTPQWKLHMVCNTLPKIRTNDDGFWRRPIFIPFTRQFAAAEIDTNIEAKLAAEKDGILAWMIEGFFDWRSRDFSFDVPQESLDMKAHFRGEADIMASWMNERILWKGWWNRKALNENKTSAEVWRQIQSEEIGDLTWAQSNFWTHDAAASPAPRYRPVEIYQDFERWCEANAYDAWQQRTFSQKFPQIARDKGAMNKKSNGEWHWRGFDFVTGGILPEPETPSTQDAEDAAAWRGGFA